METLVGMMCINKAKLRHGEERRTEESDKKKQQHKQYGDRTEKMQQKLCLWIRLVNTPVWLFSFHLFSLSSVCHVSGPEDIKAIQFFLSV